MPCQTCHSHIKARSGGAVRASRRISILAISALCLAGCSGVPTPSLQVAELGSSITATLASSTSPADEVSGDFRSETSSAETYRRIGRGLKQCWLAPERLLNTSHLYFAAAKPFAEGGGAEININEKRENGERGLIAFSVDISGGENSAHVRSRNHRLPEAVGQQMFATVAAWARSADDVTCPMDIPAEPEGVGQFVTVSAPAGN